MSGLTKKWTKTKSTTADKLSNFQITSATYGQVVSIVLGTTRIAGNLIDWYDFIAIPHTTTTRSGKGGTKTKSTDWTYTVACLIGLCEGPIAGIGTLWKDDTAYPTGAAAYGMTLFKGEYGQQPWSYTQGKHPAKALPYSGLAYAAGVIDLGSSGSLPSLNFEVKGMLLNTGDGIDANPSAVISYIASDSFNGVVTEDVLEIASLSRFNTYAKAADLLVSMPPDCMNKKAYEIINDICTALDVIVFWSQNKLKFVPLCMELISANGAVYEPNTTIEYDLTEDDFLEDGEGRTVVFERVPDTEAYNQYTVEFINRANSYENETVDGQVLVDINNRGLRTADSQTMHFFHTKKRAQYVADMLALNSLTRRNRYTFRLDWSYCLLEPGDLLTITVAALGLVKQPVCIETWEESDDGEIEVVAFGMPRGNYSAGIYNVHEAERASKDYSVDPGNVNQPVIFQPPDALSNGLDVWIGVSGGTNWGGCYVWLSDNGDTYEQIGTITSPSRQGVLSVALSNSDDPDTANTLSVDLGISRGILLSGTQDDADNYNTLCYVDGELISYETATLKAKNQYDLSYLRRGAYNTTIKEHTAGSEFLRIDNNVLFKYSFTKEQIDKKVYLKFTSFNIYGAAAESLADVEPYEHTISAQLPPNVSNITLNEDTYILKDGTVLSDIIVNFMEPTYTVLDHYNVYYDENSSGTWTYYGTAASGSGTKIKALKQAQTVKVKVTTVSTSTLESTGTTSDAYTVTGKSDPPPDVAGLTLAQDEYNRAKIILTWDTLDQAITPDLKGYEARLGNEWSTAVKINSDTIVGNTFSHTISANGSYNLLIKAIDNSGNCSKNAIAQSITALIAPDAPTNLTAVQDATDRGKLKILWTASTGKDIDGYELRIGTEWDTAEKMVYTKEASYVYAVPFSGTYNIMIKAKTVAGYMSNPNNISAAITIEPGDVTGFEVKQDMSDHSLLHLKWDNAIYGDLAFFEIREGVSWDAGTLVVTGLASLQYDVRINQEREYIFWIKSVNRSNKYSQYPSKITAIYDLNPDPVSNVVVLQDENDRSLVNVTWLGISELDFLYYDVRYGWTWEDAVRLTQTKETKYQFRPTNGTGNVKIIIKAVSTAGFYSDEATGSLYALMEPQDVENFIVQQNGEYVELYWDRAHENDVVGFEIREGWTFDYGQLIATNITGNSYKYKVDFDGIYHYWIKAINRSNRYSVTPIDYQITVVDLPPKNVIQSFDEIIMQSGSHSYTEFGVSDINWQTIGGQWSDYPTTKFEEVGGRQVLRLKKDISGSYPATGTYMCDRIDVGRIITANIAVKFLSTVKFRGETSAILQMRTSKDNSDWSVWKDFLPAKFVFRYIELKVMLSTSNPAKTPEVNRFDVMVDLPDIEKAGTIIVPVGGMRITYTTDFYIIPVVTCYAIGQGVRVEAYNRNKTGFNARILDLNNQDVGGTMDWRARGY